MPKLTRRAAASILIIAAIASCSEPVTEGHRIGASRGDLVGPVPPTTPFTPPLIPRATASDAVSPIVLSFEGFTSFAMLPTDAYAAHGVHIDGALVLNVPGYNYDWYPPHSGIGLVTAPLEGPDGDALMTLRFDSSFTRVSAFVTGRRPVTLTCVSPSGRKVGEQTHLAPNLQDDDEWSVYPVNQEIAVEGDSISNCTLVGDRNGFTVDDVTLQRVPRDVRLTVALSDTEVYPVFSHTFNALKQFNTGPTPAQQHRFDTLRVSVSAGACGSSCPREAWIVSEPVDGSGGHIHGQSTIARPRGTFFMLDQLESIHTGAAGTRDSIRLALDSMGRGAVVYRTSGVSGEERVMVRTPAETAPSDTSVVTVRLGGLVQIPVAATNYTIGPSMNHPGFDEYLQAGGLGVLDTLWARWKALHAAKPNTYPMTGTTFSIDASSLSAGGLLDIFGDWSSARGHMAHREGLDADFNNDGAERAKDLMIVECAKLYWRISPTDSASVSCIHHEGTGLHFHIFLVPLRNRDRLLAWRPKWP